MRRTALLPAARLSIAAASVTVVCASIAGCASMTPGADAADLASIAERASAVGIAPELVYTTEVDGYDLAPQSVGPGAAGGMSATWFQPETGAMLTLRSDSGEMTAASCEATPLWDAPGQAVTCAEEDGIWHRSGGGLSEYVAVRDGALIRVIGVNDAPPADLLAAAKMVHVPSDAELRLLFSDVPEVPAGPVERGDLPDNGDGAPIDPAGEGG